MWGHLGDPLSPLAPVSYKVHWTRGPLQLPGSFPQSIRTLPHPPEGVEVSPAPWGVVGHVSLRVRLRPVLPSVRFGFCVLRVSVPRVCPVRG